MGVTFGELELAPNESVTDVFLIIRVDAVSVPLAANESTTLVELGVSVDGRSEFGGFEGEPEVPPISDMGFLLGVDAVMGHGMAADGDMTFYVAIDAAAGAIADMTFQVSVDATDVVGDNGNIFFLVEDPEVISGYGGLTFASITDYLACNDQPTRLYTHVMRARLALQNPMLPTYTGTVQIRDNLAVSDQLQFLVVAVLRDMLAGAEELEGTYTAIGAILNVLVLSGAAASYAEAYAILTDMLAVAGVADAMSVAAVTDSLALQDLVRAQYLLVARLLDRVVANAELTGHYTLTAIIRDDVVFSDGVMGIADLVAVLHDAVSFSMTLGFDNGEFIAWVLNTESRGLSRYTHYPFNSMAKIGKRYYGAASDGVHRLTGDDDNGEAIAAKIRLGLFNMGTRKLKRLPEAYYALSGDGRMFIKVIIVDEETSDKAEAIYRITERVTPVQRDGRRKFGKGLVSVDYDIVLENVAGGDFSLSALQFRPLILDRRTRG